MKLAVSKIRVRNFKAIVDSGIVRLSPLTVFIGNNGSGKSSLVDALSLFQRLADVDADTALSPFRGLTFARHQLAARKIESAKGRYKSKDARSNQLCLTVGGAASKSIYSFKRPNEFSYTADICIAALDSGNRVLVAENSVKIGSAAHRKSVNRSSADRVHDALGSFCESWQFLDLEPSQMRELVNRRMSKRRSRLLPDGSNLAEFLLEMREGYGELGRAAFNGLIDAMRQVLPYANDLQPVERDLLERKVFLELSEGAGAAGFKVPGWLLSTGTLRIAALLALLRHPEPPPLLCIEEIENGLDPRTINLLVSEIQAAVERGRTQIITTTHSPYLLDLVPLDSIVLVERSDNGPRFTRPGDSESVKQWAAKFSPGRLYTMGGLAAKNPDDSKEACETGVTE